jgi:OOP family OmpA-OmpF porin
MKRLKLALVALFTLVTVGNVSAQDENNPWILGFGINTVDFIFAPVDNEDHFKDLLGSDEDWNMLPSISRIYGSKYLDKGFSVSLAGTINKIENLRDLNDSDFFYYSVDASVLYDLNNLIGDTSWFNPYIHLGGSYVSVDSNSEGMLNYGAGANFWFNDKLGLNFHSGAKYGFSDKVQPHWQHSLGFVIKFGGKDSDGDGVYDDKDACPEVAGLMEFNGCPDSDGDGIKDSDDACPNVAGLAAMNGCPDADADSIADKDDMCPNVKGTKANKGCPDTDGDGVVDKNDKCATEAGPMANGGCPWPDTDGDSVLDKDDKCPDVAGIASEGGCPEVISNEAKMGMDAFANSILFNTGRASFKEGVTGELDGMLAIMNQFPSAEFEINGYTDSTGSASNNLKLSDKRANAVRDYLVKNGIDAARLTAQGFGEESPVDTNMNRAGREKNRRVEIKVTN